MKVRVICVDSLLMGEVYSEKITVKPIKYRVLEILQHLPPKGGFFMPILIVREDKNIAD